MGYYWGLFYHRVNIDAAKVIGYEYLMIITLLRMRGKGGKEELEGRLLCSLSVPKSGTGKAESPLEHCFSDIYLRFYSKKIYTPSTVRHLADYVIL